MLIIGDIVVFNGTLFKVTNIFEEISKYLLTTLDGSKDVLVPFENEKSITKTLYIVNDI